MTESDNSKTNFAGTYFDRDSVLRLARLASIFAWISLIYYLAQAALSLATFYSPTCARLHCASRFH